MTDISYKDKDEIKNLIFEAKDGNTIYAEDINNLQHALLQLILHQGGLESIEFVEKGKEKRKINFIYKPVPFRAKTVEIDDKGSEEITIDEKKVVKKEIFVEFKPHCSWKDKDSFNCVVLPYGITNDTLKYYNYVGCKFDSNKLTLKIEIKKEIGGEEKKKKNRFLVIVINQTALEEI